VISQIETEDSEWDPPAIARLRRCTYSVANREQGILDDVLEALIEQSCDIEIRTRRRRLFRRLLSDDCIPSANDDASQRSSSDYEEGVRYSADLSIRSAGSALHRFLGRLMGRDTDVYD
jgi:hypothetical protein